MAGGSKLVRVCTCEDFAPDALELRVPQLLFPVCQLWPAVGELASAADQLLPGWAGETGLSELRGYANLKEWRGPSRSDSGRGPLL